MAGSDRRRDPGPRAPAPRPVPYDVEGADLERAVAALDGAATSLDDDGLLVGLMRLVALVSADGRDAHTGLYAWGEGEYPLTSLPLRLWVFDDGVHVVTALPPYEDLVGARDRRGRWPSDDEGRRDSGPADPTRQRRDGEAAAAPVHADPRGAAWRRPRRRSAVRVPDGRPRRGVDADGRRRADLDGRLQRMGRTVRPPPARRPAHPLPGPSERAAVVRGRGARCRLRRVQPGRRGAGRRPRGPEGPARRARRRRRRHRHPAQLRRRGPRDGSHAPDAVRRARDGATAGS